MVELFETIGRFFVEFWLGIYNFFAGIGPWFANNSKIIESLMVELFETIGRFFVEFWLGIYNFFAGIGPWFANNSKIIESLMEGFGKNCWLFALTLVMSIPLGLIISFGSMSKFAPLRWLSRTFVWIIRGTPLMLQLFVVFYAPGLLFDMPMRSREIAALIAFVINYAAYFSEIFRGGIEGIPKGQYEACQVLGMTKGQTFFKVVLMQVVKRITAPMGNEIITLTKDTSLANTIAVSELLFCAGRFTKKGLIWPLFSTAIYFLLFNLVLTLLFGWIEKKLNYYKG